MLVAEMDFRFVKRRNTTSARRHEMRLRGVVVVPYVIVIAITTTFDSEKIDYD